MRCLFCCARGARRAAGWPVAAVALVLGLASAGDVRAESDLVRVEEEWELVVAEPADDTSAPQVTTVLSPVGDLDTAYAAFEINHRSVPSFVAGGLHLHLWQAGTLAATTTVDSSRVLNSPQEVITWTQAVSVADGELCFELYDGDSLTWGRFGHGERARVRQATTLANLNGYSSTVSVGNSGVGYASNRVASLVIKRVKGYTSAGDVVVDDTPRVVFARD